MLEPYTLLDFTDERGKIGPMLLGDLGADAIKVKLPGGSPSCCSAPIFDAGSQDLKSLSFISFNRNVSVHVSAFVSRIQHHVLC